MPDTDRGGPRERSPRLDSEHLARLRHRLGLTIEAFAKKCKVSAKQLGEWERNPGIKINMQSLRKLAQGAETPIDELILEWKPARLISTHAELVAENLTIIAQAQQFLYVTGARSRDVPYLKAIERAVAERPNLIHRRVLFGPPRTQEMREHVIEILRIRAHRPVIAQGVRAIVVSLYESDRNFPPEAAICMNERSALIILPSINGSWTYDTAVVFEDRTVLNGWKRWIDTICNTASHLIAEETVPPVRETLGA